MMDKRKPKGKRLIIVSNRLPFTIKKVDGSYQFGESVGGLATGLRTYLESMKISSNENLDYAWVGWPGATIEDHFKEEVKSRTIAEYRSYPVFLSEEDMEKFYHGFCNKTIWPLFHYFPSFTIYQEDYWQHYNKVNEIFCNTLINIVNQDDLVWIHDYHLMLLPLLLQARTPNIPIGFFLHIPFPSFEIFRLLPDRWRRKILEGLLGANLIGFHTYDYMQHFLQCVLRILGCEHHMGQIMLPSRIVKVDTFPMGIDFKKYSTAMNDSEIQCETKNLKKALSDVRIILSVDRLDYSKGILNRLHGYEILLDQQPQFRNKVVLILIIVPSRIGVEHYEQMKKQIEELVGKINGRFGTISWTPILYQYKYLPFQPLAALYNISDVALVTPLRDGMNLIAKEYVASKANEQGVLILSEMAGSAKELGEAIIINPNNREEIASALREALEIPEDEQTRRMKIMRLRLQRYDIIRWGSEFVHQLIDATELQIRNYVKVLTNPHKLTLIKNYKNSSHRLIFLDYDGTLTPFTRSPHQAKPNDRILKLLCSLTDDQKNIVVIISGRERSSLQRWFGNLAVSLVAEHGVWVKEPNKEWKLIQEHSNTWKQSILPILEMYSDHLPGAFVEEKEYSVSWHYRAADPEHAISVTRELKDHLVNFTANINLQITQGNKVIEIRTIGIDKGTAAKYWITNFNADFILAIGDDWTDEDLFLNLPDFAYSIKVGITNTHAKYNVRNTEDVIKLLDLLTQSINEIQVNQEAPNDLSPV